ncbi:hypothetical protein ZWY2020_048927 [Hordeum vulgare]|nr:hypothetical protein ZWY2020_048927 [Hordeum vulgare]
MPPLPVLRVACRALAGGGHPASSPPVHDNYYPTTRTGLLFARRCSSDRVSDSVKQEQAHIVNHRCRLYVLFRVAERSEENVVVIGSGLGGLCCAGLLARYG